MGNFKYSGHKAQYCAYCGDDGPHLTASGVHACSAHADEVGTSTIAYNDLTGELIPANEIASFVANLSLAD